MLHSSYSSFFRTLDGGVCQRMVRLFADLQFWDRTSPFLLKSFAGFIQIISDQTANSLKGFKLVSYLVYVVLLDFRKELENRVIKRGHSLVAVYRPETEQSEGMIEATIGGLMKSCTILLCSS